jgi:rhamnosyltransferase
MAISTIPSIHAVIVTFNAEPLRFLTLLQQISKQVEKVIVVDNASDISASVILAELGNSGKHELIELQENFGIGTAQNIGLRKAIHNGAQFIILFDHDSEPSDNLVPSLLAAYRKKKKDGYQVAAVGPRFRDKRNNDLSSFVKLEGYKLRKAGCPGENSIIEVDHLISSGSLVCTHSLQEIGFMREDLFIDYVDIEWCLRARKKGYQCFGVCNAVMTHSLGDDPIKHIGRTHTSHSSLRQYYLFRNRVFLYKQQWIPLRWRIADSYRLLLRYAFYTTLIAPKFEHWKMMHLGIRDGLLSRLGKFPDRQLPSQR